MPSSNYAYVNGRFLPEAAATVSVLDRGYLHGHGVFETMRVYGGRMFRAAEHMDRMFAGMRALGIESVFSPEELRAVCRVLIERNAVQEGVARVHRTPDSTVVTARSGPLKPVVLSAIVSTVRVQRQLSRHKTANRLPYILALREAKDKDADEAVLLNDDGHVVEFANSNLFVVKDGRLRTPPLQDGPLPGITRHAVLGLAAELNIPVIETGFGPECLENADEVFATNSLIEIAPVANWGRSERITSRLQQAYRQLVRDELHLGC
jgi:branched-subunit amino acid aminotransferase/4-amino-4-deoxychorismate lyase